MPLKDVTVKIDIKKAAKVVALGKPLILAEFAGPQTYKSYSEPETVEAIFGKDSVVSKLATTLLKQGDSSTATIAIATYDTNADPASTAVDALNKYYDEDWYFVVEDTQVLEEVKAIADVVEGEGVKMHGTTTKVIESLEALNNMKYDRTFTMFHKTVDEYPTEALIGGHGSKDVGSITYKDKKLVGITPQEVTTAELADIEALNSFMYVPKFGVNVTSEGTVLSGEYIDVIHSKDWIKINVENAVQNVFTINEKVAYTNKGILLLEVAVENVLKAAYTQGMIAENDDGQPSYEIKTLKRSETNPADRAARIYKGLSFNFELAGAIHAAQISGEIII